MEGGLNVIHKQIVANLKSQELVYEANFFKKLLFTLLWWHISLFMHICTYLKIQHFILKHLLDIFWVWFSISKLQNLKYPLLLYAFFECRSRLQQGILNGIACWVGVARDECFKVGICLWGYLCGCVDSFVTWTKGPS
jgi:hypothetical protein